MFNKLKSFFLTSLLGGVTVVLPIALIVGICSWIFVKTTATIQPLTDIVLKNSGIKEILADLIVCLILIISCFLIGLFERTKLGKLILEFLEKKALKKVPAYNLIKETILQFTGKNKSPFTRVALVDLFGNGTLVTAFITDKTDIIIPLTFHDSKQRYQDQEYVTVFMPTGPNPTSGNIYHVDKDRVMEIDVPVEDVMRTVIGCGLGSSILFKALKKKKCPDLPKNQKDTKNG